MKHITGYTSRWSVEPGEQIPFMVSCYGSSTYDADIVQIKSGETVPEGPDLSVDPVDTDIDGNYDGREQAIHAGSYVRVDDEGSLAVDQSLSLQTLAYPTLPTAGRQALVTKWDEDNKSGYGLFLDEDSHLELVLGNGETAHEYRTEEPVEANHWYFLAASADLTEGTVNLHQHPLETTKDRTLYSSKSQDASFDISSDLERIGTPGVPCMIGASAVKSDGDSVGTKCYTGKLEAPAIGETAVSVSEMKERTTQQKSSDSTLLGAWDFASEISANGISSFDTVTDTTTRNNHGTLVNVPTRAVTGHSWTGAYHEFTEAPDEYAAIHFHADDLGDANWDVDFEWTVPEGQESGVYAARLRTDGDESYIPFFVRPPTGAATADILFLAPTNSYLAYANDHMVTDGAATELLIGRTPSLQPEDIFLSEHREYGLSCYDTHADGHGVFYSSRLRPILNLSPTYKHWLAAPPGSVWQFNADLHLIDWLETKEYNYDVVTDEDLHFDGIDLLESYDVVLTGTHPEYYSLEMWETISTYQDRGGRLMYMGANGFYWQTAFHPEEPNVIEIRKGDTGIRTYDIPNGELNLSFTGEKGGMWRQRDKAPQKLVGIGFSAQGFDDCSYYRRQADSNESEMDFIFENVDSDVIGDFGLIGGGAAGLEVDRYDQSLGTPDNTYLLASSEDHSDNYLHVVEEILATTPALSGTEDPQVRGDMVYFKTPNEGGVFSTGSIAWCGSLATNDYDNNISQITENVLETFLTEETLPGADP
ncbi:N,N-dimethylformamidase beta subunit family domain-containing protein [Natronococcus jeotgali]|uniref:N,N-dimethylformamidase beta subunit family domain-containing protein n=1 Tax=Natronococcus jeotgali TaxID=413812 RepID=UPI000A9F2F58|nr:N,N-dimethylformamidase beta subunit family domain-containing protein [Natronococcus jeotgali]